MSKKVLDIIRQEDDITILPGGIKVKFSQVPLSIIDAINQKHLDPDPPMVKIEEKSEPGNPWMESNPNDPDYHVELEKAARVRGNAIIDAMIIMGVELVDPIPDDGWLVKLAYLEKVTGVPKLSNYDLEDDFEKEFVYKKFYAIGRDGMTGLLKGTGVTEEGISDAMNSFPSDEERGPDTDA